MPADPDSRAIAVVRQLVRTGRYERALRAADEVGPRAAADPAVLALRAACCVALRRYADARGLAEAGLAHRPESVPLLTLLARAHLGAGDAPDALAATTRALAVDPDDATALALHGHALQATGQPAEADHALRAALDRDPRAALPHLLRAHAALRRGDGAAALAITGPALHDHADNGNLLWLHGLALRATGRYRQSRVALRHALDAGGPTDELIAGLRTATVLAGGIAAPLRIFDPVRHRWWWIAVAVALVVAWFAVPVPARWLPAAAWLTWFGYACYGVAVHYRARP